jgi:hypothetical protein
MKKICEQIKGATKQTVEFQQLPLRRLKASLAALVRLLGGGASIEAAYSSAVSA